MRKNFISSLRKIAILFFTYMALASVFLALMLTFYYALHSDPLVLPYIAVSLPLGFFCSLIGLFIDYIDVVRRLRKYEEA